MTSFDECGRVYLNNRYHDPGLGQFISVDPLVHKTGHPYLYGDGNPSTLSDPTGLCATFRSVQGSDGVWRGGSTDDGRGSCDLQAAKRVWDKVKPSSVVSGFDDGFLSKAGDTFKAISCLADSGCAANLTVNAGKDPVGAVKAAVSGLVNAEHCGSGNAISKCLGAFTFDALTLFTTKAVATNTATREAVGGAADGLTRVGRWMSPEEYAAMVRTGEVQVGAGGTTYVANPANVNAFTPNRFPSNYVEFDVPASSLRLGQPGWGQIPSPDSVWGRLAAKQGVPVQTPVLACNIVLVATRSAC